MNQTLSQPALDVIQNYLSLPFPGKQVSCPYFNNRRVRLRGGLRALIGKGNPEDIVEEAMIISLREKIDLKKLSDQNLKQFLVEHKLGIDCSGLVYHILDAEMKAQGKGSLHQVLKRPWFKNPIRKLLVKLRPIENTGVGTFNHEVNSIEVSLKDIQPGDLIIMMGAGLKQDYNHILIINQITDNKIQYTHSFQYPTDGQYNHGVRQEAITIVNLNKNILEQNWSEPQMRKYAQEAKKVKIKRLSF